MKDGNKVMIQEIMDALQKEEGYPKPERAFRIGWDGWRMWCLRHGMRGTTFFAKRWQEGWLMRADAEELCNYLKKGWNPGFLRQT